MNDLLNEILPETYKKGYFYSSLSNKDKVISFLRSVIYINYENCMNTIDTNKQLNKACYDEIKNIHKRGNLMIGNTKLYDFFEEKCYYRNKLLIEDCKHKGFFLISENKNKFNKYLKNELNFSDKTINEIDKYIDPKKIRQIKKIKSSIITNDTTNFSYITPTRYSYKNPLVETPGVFHKPKTIPPVITSKNTTTRKHTHTTKINNWKEQEETLKRQNQFKQNRSSRIISRKLRENPKSLLSYNLHNICSDAGYCIAFGKKTELIKRLFEEFNNPEFIKSMTTLSSGNNGEVLEVLFERYKYQAYTILKMMIKTNKIVDNLVYEYIVGKFLINKYYKKFPCFLETYGFIFNDQIEHIKYNKEFFNIQNIEIPQIKTLLTYGCTDEKNFGLVIEYVKNPKTLMDKLNNNSFWYKDLLNVLFQVYYTLFLMRDIFTHYDLHANNVLVFKPKKNHYIQYHYHYRGEVISFKSNYLVKIIDYGRCGFVNNEDNIKSRDIYHELCSIKECKEQNSKPCGARKGFIISVPDNESYMTPRKINNSHDLRLLKLVGYYFNNKVDDPLKFLRQFNKIDRQHIYLLLNGVKFINNFGTPEVKTSGLTRDFKTSSINNITDAFVILKELLQIPYIITQNDNFYNNKKKLGDLNIYDDGKDMEFHEI